MSTSNPRPEIWILTDWDETITAHDTLALIAPPDSSGDDAPPPFSYFGKYYMDLVTEHEKAFGPRNTMQRQLAYLESLAPVEAASIKEVEDKGLFKDVLETDIQERAKRVEFRDGWKAFTEYAQQKDHVRLIGILSVNWSKVFIEAALRRVHDDAFMKEFEIRANNVEMDSQGRGTGKLTKGTGVGICTAFDKLREMNSVLSSRFLGAKAPYTVVYIGDSNTDLLCLLHAEIGIIMGSNEDFLATCERLGIQVSRDLSTEGLTNYGGTLYNCKDWNEVINSGLLE